MRGYAAALTATFVALLVSDARATCSVAQGEAGSHETDNLLDGANSGSAENSRVPDADSATVQVNVTCNGADDDDSANVVTFFDTTAASSISGFDSVPSTGTAACSVSLVSAAGSSTTHTYEIDCSSGTYDGFLYVGLTAAYHGSENIASDGELQIGWHSTPGAVRFTDAVVLTPETQPLSWSGSVRPESGGASDNDISIEYGIGTASTDPAHSLAAMRVCIERVPKEHDWEPVVGEFAVKVQDVTLQSDDGGTPYFREDPSNSGDATLQGTQSGTTVNYFVDNVTNVNNALEFDTGYDGVKLNWTETSTGDKCFLVALADPTEDPEDLSVSALTEKLRLRMDLVSETPIYYDPDIWGDTKSATWIQDGERALDVTYDARETLELRWASAAELLEAHSGFSSAALDTGSGLHYIQDLNTEDDTGVLSAIAYRTCPPGVTSAHASKFLGNGTVYSGNDWIFSLTPATFDSYTQMLQDLDDANSDDVEAIGFFSVSDLSSVGFCGTTANWWADSTLLNGPRDVVDALPNHYDECTSSLDRGLKAVSIGAQKCGLSADSATMIVMRIGDKIYRDQTNGDNNELASSGLPANAPLGTKFKLGLDSGENGAERDSHNPTYVITDRAEAGSTAGEPGRIHGYDTLRVDTRVFVGGASLADASGDTKVDIEIGFPELDSGADLPLVHGVHIGSSCPDIFGTAESGNPFASMTRSGACSNLGSGFETATLTKEGLNATNTDGSDLYTAWEDLVIGTTDDDKAMFSTYAGSYVTRTSFNPSTGFDTSATSGKKLTLTKTLEELLACSDAPGGGRAVTSEDDPDTGSTKYTVPVTVAKFGGSGDSVVKPVMCETYTFTLTLGATFQASAAPTVGSLDMEAFLHSASLVQETSSTICANTIEGARDLDGNGNDDVLRGASSLQYQPYDTAGVSASAFCGYDGDPLSHMYSLDLTVGIRIRSTNDDDFAVAGLIDPRAFLSNTDLDYAVGAHSALGVASDNMYGVRREATEAPRYSSVEYISSHSKGGDFTLFFVTYRTAPVPFVHTNDGSPDKESFTKGWDKSGTNGQGTNKFGFTVPLFRPPEYTLSWDDALRNHKQENFVFLGRATVDVTSTIKLHATTELSTSANSQGVIESALLLLPAGRTAPKSLKEHPLTVHGDSLVLALAETNQFFKDSSKLVIRNLKLARLKKSSQAHDFLQGCDDASTHDGCDGTGTQLYNYDASTDTGGIWTNVKDDRCELRAWQDHKDGDSGDGVNPVAQTLRIIEAYRPVPNPYSVDHGPDTTPDPYQLTMGYSCSSIYTHKTPGAPGSFSNLCPSENGEAKNLPKCGSETGSVFGNIANDQVDADLQVFTTNNHILGSDAAVIPTFGLDTQSDNDNYLICAEVETVDCGTATTMSSSEADSYVTTTDLEAPLEDKKVNGYFGNTLTHEQHRGVTRPSGGRRLLTLRASARELLQQDGATAFYPRVGSATNGVNPSIRLTSNRSAGAQQDFDSTCRADGSCALNDGQSADSEGLPAFVWAAVAVGGLLFVGAPAIYCWSKSPATGSSRDGFKRVPVE